ncbi:MAG: gliding motility-associated C-terminal domain-containing protein [Bacteroidetes bacterium]|nr:gliding motility-associated C-terminal domain-containing protein [Bacteroidota bacterium]
MQSSALTPPNLRCISVVNNGNVSINWVNSVDTAGFDSYHVYRGATLNGIYNDIATITVVNQTTYFDNTVNANNQSYFYYIKCKSRANVYTISSDTLQSIHLLVTNTGGGLANLAWNAIHTPKLPTTASYYQIYKTKSLSNPWSKVDSTQNLIYNDTVKVCHDTVYYRIEIKDAFNCTSVSSYDGKLFEDLTAPLFNGMDTVSVDYISGKVKLGWHPSPSLDTWGYIICHGSPCIVIDTVWGRLSSSYIDSLFNPCSATQSYRIAAFDSCKNTSILSDYHTTILLKSSLDICASQIKLNWTAYTNMNPTVSGYRVMMSKNGGAFNILATTNASKLDYILNNIEDSTSYCFYIQAYENTGQNTSSSCQKCYYIIKPRKPKYLYIRTATVVSDNQIDIKIHTDPAALVTAYSVYKSKSASGAFVKITDLPPTASTDFTYTDYAVNTQKYSYYYKTTSLDSCGNYGITSNTAHTILLKVAPLEGNTNKLEWSDYGDWAGNVDTYSIFRDNSNNVFSIIGNVSSSTFQYLDDVQNFTSGNGKFKYYVKANEKSNSIYSFTEESNSNEVETVQQPEMFIPNAIVPSDNINNVFKPVMAFVSSENYLMQIYNRFGQLIFDNNNPQIGWDGKFDGKIVPSGVYVYLIRFSLPNHELVQKKGIVTVVN